MDNQSVRIQLEPRRKPGRRNWSRFREWWKVPFGLDLMRVRPCCHWSCAERGRRRRRKEGADRSSSLETRVRRGPGRVLTAVSVRTPASRHGTLPTPARGKRSEHSCWNEGELFYPGRRSAGPGMTSSVHDGEDDDLGDLPEGLLPEGVLDDAADDDVPLRAKPLPAPRKPPPASPRRMTTTREEDDETAPDAARGKVRPSLTPPRLPSRAHRPDTAIAGRSLRSRRISRRVSRASRRPPGSTHEPTLPSIENGSLGD